MHLGQRPIQAGGEGLQEVGHEERDAHEGWDVLGCGAEAGEGAGRKVVAPAPGLRHSKRKEGGQQGEESRELVGLDEVGGADMADHQGEERGRRKPNDAPILPPADAVDNHHAPHPRRRRHQPPEQRENRRVPEVVHGEGIGVREQPGHPAHDEVGAVEHEQHVHVKRRLVEPVRVQVARPEPHG